MRRAPRGVSLGQTRGSDHLCGRRCGDPLIAHRNGLFAMFQVTREINFCYGHRLLDYEGKCSRLHGHNGHVLITLEASGLDGQGMVVDFSEIKRVVQGWVDEELDHRMILRRDDPAVAVLTKLGEPLFLMDVNPTAENLARLIHDHARSRGFPVVEVQFWETPYCRAAYRAE
ncbi:MAG: 6-carboxytetrahydropterin synthase [Pirellulales bacterium]|nr:6-carboxytetrahydropterin synthase [Pirellulales bacterium]